MEQKLREQLLSSVGALATPVHYVSDEGSMPIHVFALRVEKPEQKLLDELPLAELTVQPVLEPTASGASSASPKKHFTRNNVARMADQQLVE